MPAGKPSPKDKANWEKAEDAGTDSSQVLILEPVHAPMSQ